MTAPSTDTPEDQERARWLSLTLNNSLSGAVGLLHQQTAMSGAPGTFRLNFVSGMYSGSGFLCQSEGDCIRPAGMDTDTVEDDAKSVTADLTISATLFSFLEAYAGMHSAAASNSFGRPRLLQVVGDTNLGVKAFAPAKPDRIFHFGGSAELWLLNGTGELGIDTANVTFRGLAGLDFTQYASPKKRLPLRFHGTLGYLVDSSGGLVEDTEDNRAAPVSRVERFGLDINRVDSFLIGLGAEYVHRRVQPFVEWTIDVPNNRQDYSCDPTLASPGDKCLGDASGFSTTPSRLSLGAKVFPGPLGLEGLLALDVGLGATSEFIEEVAPEAPWKVYFGIGYAYDINNAAPPPPPAKPAEPLVIREPPPEYRVVGLVIDERSQQPIPGAIIRYQDANLTGMVSRTDGSFETTNLEPGSYTFTIKADNYREGTCAVVVTAQAPSSATAGTAPIATTDPLAAPNAQPPAVAPATAPNSPSITNVACPLKALPAVGTVQGSILDAQSSSPIIGAKIKIRDARSRELTLEADSTGSYRFENVPAGATRLTIDASGYLPAFVDVDVKARGDHHPTITLNKMPKKGSVTVTPKELKLSKPIRFAEEAATILPDSMVVVQELAAVLNARPQLVRIEIQGYMDNSGAPSFDKRLSQERADAVRANLISLGVDGSRLTAMGYGQEKPLVPNVSEANRLKNRRIQVMILQGP